MIVELKELLYAELAYAHFNARRTSEKASNETIRTGDIGGAPFLADTSRPESEYYNRLVIPPDLESIDEIVKQVPASIMAVELFQTHSAESDYACLSDAGFRMGSSLCYLVSTPQVERAEFHRVRRLNSNEAPLFMEMLELSGASFSDEKRRHSMTFFCTDIFHCFVAYDDDDQPTGWATMFVDNGFAFLGNAFTLPRYRNQGFHGALISARLKFANELNLLCVFTDVQNGSQSHGNCFKKGFRALSVNSIWKRAS